MKSSNCIKSLAFAGLIAFSSCSSKMIVSEDQVQRVNSYVHSEHTNVSDMFSDEDMLSYGIQPFLTHKELAVLDILVDRIDPEVRNEFDKKYLSWLLCWLPIDSMPEEEFILRQTLKCDGREFVDSVNFCRLQDDDIFLLLYQLASRASCPYDQLLLQPAHFILDYFPEYNKYWQEVDLIMQKEKPHLNSRTCNESTIWQVRKILETKYGYTYKSGLTSFFNTQKMLVMNYQ